MELAMRKTLIDPGSLRRLWVIVSFAVLPNVGFTQVRPPIAPDTETANPAYLANLPAQPIGADDLIGISVYDTPELTRTVRVSADGFITLPLLNQRVKAQGLMPRELESAIAQALQSEQILVDPIVTVTIAEYTSRPISVVGAVKQPLTFQASQPVTLLEAIGRAGGLAPEAGPEILISRTRPRSDDTPGRIPPSPVQRIPVKGLISAADPALNILLNGGEEVRVPEVGKVYVIGNVKMPGAYPVGDGTESSVLKMLALSQGLMPHAGKIAYIYRREANRNKNEIPIELNKIMERKSPDVPLLASDILYVPENKGTRLTADALEKVLLLSSGAAAAVIYTLR
jgi:polysaccharide export outer membrane protein